MSGIAIPHPGTGAFPAVHAPKEAGKRRGRRFDEDSGKERRRHGPAPSSVYEAAEIWERLSAASSVSACRILHPCIFSR